MVRASLAVLLVLATVPLVPGAAASPVEEVRDLVHDCVFSMIPEDCLTQRLHDARREAEALLRCLTMTGPCP